MRFMTEEEINEAKANKSVRDKIKATIEDSMDIGEMEMCSIDELGGYGMGRRVVTEDAIRAFCNANGDLNPLYRSRDYARNSIHGGLIAPPHFLSTIAGFTGAGVRRRKELEFAATGADAGSRVEWFKTIREGDEFTVFDIPTEVIDLTKEHTAIQFLSRGNRIYKNQKDEVVAIAGGSVIQMIIAPPKEKQGGSREPPKIRHFSEEEVEEWFQLTEKEEIRGAAPRFWEDVNVDDELPPTHHVFTMMENVAYLVGSGVGSGNWHFEMLRSKGAWKRALDPETGLPDFASMHMTDIAARRFGMPLTNSAGIQMCCWLGRLVTNWMGDTGFLKKMDVQYRRSLWRGSFALCKGKVEKKYTEGDKHLVDLHISLEDHNGDMMIPNGSATVILPSKHMENWRP